jgi:hypothetical protein
LYPPRIASEPPVKKPAICFVLESRVSKFGAGFTCNSVIAVDLLAVCPNLRGLGRSCGLGDHKPTVALEARRSRGNVRIFLFPYALNSAVECAEQAAPDAKVASQYRRAHLDRCDGA